MDLWLARHGEAVPASVDVSRPLSEPGVRAVTEAGIFLAAVSGRFDLVASSRRRRARQTAEILAAAAGYPPDRIEETDALSPDVPPGELLAFLEGKREVGRVLCVGHLPSIAAIASHLLSGGESIRLVFNPGSLCRIRLADIAPGNGELLLFR